MGIKGILLDLKSYIKAIEKAGNIELWKKYKLVLLFILIL